MVDKATFQLQRLFPQIYLACHVDHVRASSTSWNLSAHDSSILAHLDVSTGTSPRSLAAHLGVAASTLSASVSRLEQLGYITTAARPSDRRYRDIWLTEKGAEALSGTSVLDTDRARRLLAKLSDSERDAALAGLALLARAAREIMEDK